MSSINLKGQPWSVLVGVFIGTIIIVCSRTIFRLHLARPHLTVMFYLGLLALVMLLSEHWWLSILPVGLAFLFWKCVRPKMLLRAERKAYKQRIYALMEVTLWEDVKPKKFVRITETEMTGVHRIDFATPLGQPDEAVLKVLPVFKSGLALTDTIVLADDHSHDGLVSVLFCETSPLEARLDGSHAPVLHLTDEQKSDPYEWLPVGVDANGSHYDIPLFLEEGGSVRQMCAGASGSGKSSVLRQQLLQAVLNTNIDVVVFDGKGSEFGIFKPYVQHFGTTKKDFFAQLRFLEDEIERRGVVLNANKLNQPDRFSQSWNVQDDGSFLLWVWDELGATLGKLESRERSEVQIRLYSILSVARSLGVGCIFSSQTFKSTILNTDIRDNCFDFSIGYKMDSAIESSYIHFDPNDEGTAHVLVDSWG